MIKGDVIIGMGDVGKPFHELLSQSGIKVRGIDLIEEKNYGDLIEPPIEILHICFPYSPVFIEETVKEINRWKPSETVIHSTIKPHVTEELQDIMDIPIIYSPIRGVHNRMITDLKRYKKIFSSKEITKVKKYPKRLEEIGLEWETLSNPLTLEYAKILVDTTYYGWLIIYAQHTNEICLEENIDFDEMWSFSEQIHKELGNRPKMYPGEGIGGKCVIQNTKLIEDEFISTVFNHDKQYRININRNNKSLKKRKGS